MARTYDTDTPYNVGLYDWTQGTIAPITDPAGQTATITPSTHNTATMTPGG